MYSHRYIFELKNSKTKRLDKNVLNIQIKGALSITINSSFVLKSYANIFVLINPMKK